MGLFREERKPMKLVIAEKPSVAQTLAKVIGAYKREDGYLEGSGYLVSWCVGHLVSLVPPYGYDPKYSRWRQEDLPIIPEKWKWEVSGGKKEQYEVLKKLMFREDVDEIICATDAGREGELIFRLVYNQTGCRKPFQRLWISSMEDQAIAEGFDNLRDGHEYDSLYQAALCRSEADWLVGMNATRLFTTQYHHRLTVGRVQSPTLAMLSARNQQISNFQKQKYYNVHLTMPVLNAVQEKIPDEKQASEICRKCEGQTAVVESVSQTEKKVNPPRLYDLTSLQREANRYLGYTAAQTLEYAQSLYEKKLVTYPRTDSQFLTDDMQETAEQMVRLARADLGFPEIPPDGLDIVRVLNSSKVSDHTAIIPTAQIKEADRSALTDGERNVLLLIEFRLLCATGTAHRYQETDILISCAGEKFKAKGRIVLDAGWKAYEERLQAQIRKEQPKQADNPDEAEKADEQALPELSEGQTLGSVQTDISEHFTSPPKQYTEDSLLAAMETAGNESFDEGTEKKGLGTPATRAAIIEKLVSSGYAKRKGRQLIPTQDGIQMVEILPDTLKSPKLTAEWENMLEQVEKGEADPEAFMTGIKSMVEDLVYDRPELTEEEQKRFGEDRPQREQIGTCPRCGSPVYEGKKNFYCSDKACGFCIWKDSKWLSGMKKSISRPMAKSFLKDGRVRNVTLYSKKKDRNFNADLVLEDTGTYVNFKLEFPKRKEVKH